MKTKTYLGDGVYAKQTQWGMLTLTTENGIYATNTIHLEAEVYHALQLFMKSAQETLEPPDGSFVCDGCKRIMPPEDLVEFEVGKPGEEVHHKACRQCYEERS